jgi:Ca2+-binding RTX toxin-like protein
VASSPLLLNVNANNSYSVVTMVPGTTNTKSYIYDPQGNLTTVQTDNARGDILTSVTNTQALINIYDTNGNLIGTIAQPSTSVLRQPVFDIAPQDAAASTDSGPTGSVVNLLSETNNFVSSGNDNITVDSGTATIIATGPSTVVNNISANVAFYAGPGSAMVNGGSGSVIAIGGAAGGTLTGGSAGNNILAANGGNTTLNGAGNGDALFGSNTGVDTLNGAVGSEALIGGAGTETIKASAGNVACGGSGNSTLDAAHGGGSTLFGGSGTSTLVAADGAESMWSGSGNSTLRGGSGNDIMGGSVDANSTSLMLGGTGAMTFLGGAGTVSAVGGTGDDTFWTSTGSMAVTEGAGNDSVYFGSGHATVNGGVGTDLYSFLSGHAGGVDIINDFKVGIDHIELFGYGSNVAQPQASDGNLSIVLGDNTHITRMGVTELAANSIAYG